MQRDHAPLLLIAATALAAGCGTMLFDPGRLVGRIVFTSARDGNPQTYVTNADGSGLTRLTTHPEGDWHPHWR